MTDDADADPADELDAMNTVASALRALTPSPRERVLAWAVAKFGDGLAKYTADHQMLNPGPLTQMARAESTGSAEYGSFAELIEATELRSNSDRALFAGFWLQEYEADDSFDGRSVNKLLKEHGIDVSNVTNALSSLINSKPRLAMQAGKKGKFEKLYRLTTEGKKQVRQRLNEGSTDD